MSARDALQSDVILKIRPPTVDTEVPMIKEGALLMAYINPASNEELIKAMQVGDVLAKEIKPKRRVCVGGSLVP